MNKDNTVRQAGGFIVQLMPFAEESTIAKLEENVQKITSVTNLLEEGHTPESLLEKVLEGFDMEINEKVPTEFYCNCRREEILRVHAKDKPLGEDVNLAQIARTTAGFTGADLENLLNEAAIEAARKGRGFILQSDIKGAFIKVGIGAEKKSKVISEKEKKITAYHESGHAILFHVLPDMDPVYTISIIPTGMGAAGYTMPLPDNDEMFNTKGKMLQDIMTLLGGRIAEEIIFGDITTGASNDIKRATATARSMVMKYGMSDKLGLICYGDDDDEVFIGRDLAHTRSYSEDVAKSIDEEIRRIISECHDQAKKIILEHEDVLHKCASLLLEKEKVHRDEFEALFITENPETENNSI